MDRKEVIRRISTLRYRANLSARALSHLIDMNDGYISGLESNKNFVPKMEVLFRIIDVCGSTPEEFFYENFDKYKIDKKTFLFLDSLSQTQKEAIVNLYKN